MFSWYLYCDKCLYRRYNLGISLRKVEDGSPFFKAKFLREVLSQYPRKNVMQFLVLFLKLEVNNTALCTTCRICFLNTNEKYHYPRPIRQGFTNYVIALSTVIS